MAWKFQRPIRTTWASDLINNTISSSVHVVDNGPFSETNPRLYFGETSHLDHVHSGEDRR